MTSSSDDLLFAEHALRRGLVTEDQVDEILRIQEKVAEMGVPDALPSLMVKRGLLEPKDADAILASIRPRDRKEQIEGYRLLRRLGHGGMGSVYLARQVALDRLVALKVLRPSLTKDEQQVERLRREAQLVGKLAHPNIVRGLDMGESGGFHYFAMEYIEGQTLKDLLKSGKPLKEAEALGIARDVARALDHAWRQRITHRDVKPGNILVRPNGDALLMDYGLAKGPLDLSLTQTGATLGTPQYLSPEQARNPRDVDIRTDLYALGATLFHMLAGRAPFSGENLAEIVTQVLMKPHEPPQSLNPKISANAAFVIERLMAKDPRHRYQAPRDLLRDLEAVEKGRSIVPAGWEGDWRAFVLRRRYHRLIQAAAVVTVVALASAAYAIWNNWSAKREAHRHALEQARVEASLQERHVTLEGVQEWRDRLRALESTFGEEEPWFRERREVWDRVVAMAKRIEAADRGRGAAEDDFATRLAHLEELRTEARGLPVVEDALEGAIRAIRDGAPDLARSRYADRRGKTYLTLDEFDQALAALEALLERNWPTELRGPVPGEILRDRQAVGVLRLELAETETCSREALESLVSAGRFQEAMTRLEKRIRESDEAVTEAILVVPDQVARVFRSKRDELVASIARADLDARAALVQEKDRILLESNDPAKFAEAITRFRQRAGDALKESREPLAGGADALETEAKRRRSGAEASFRKKMEPDFLTSLRNRSVDAAAALLEDARTLRLEDGTAIAPWVAEDIERAQGDLREVKGFWDRVRDRLTAARGRTVETLRTRKDRIGTGTVTVEDVKGWTLTGRDGNGHPVEVNLHELELENALALAGLVKPETPEDRRVAGVVRLLLEPGSSEDLLAEIRRLEEIHGLLVVGDRTDRYRQGVDGLLDGLRARQAERETEAEGLFREAKKDFDEGKWKAALDGFALFEKPAYKYTEFRIENADRIGSFVARCRARVADDETTRARFHGGRFEFREGYENLAENRAGPALASVTWPLDADEERLDLGLDDARARIRTMPLDADPIGPHPGGGPAAASERRALVLLQGDTPPELLQNRPVVLENPFLANAPMVLEVDVRSPRPVFLAISLAGFACGILSQDDRVEGGRGVAFWTGKELTGLDARPEVQDLRRPAVDRALEAESLTPGERLRLEETRYFRMLPDRWYRLRLEKGDRDLTLRVDGRVVATWPLPRLNPPDREHIELLAFTTTCLDNLRIEGTVDPRWWGNRER